MNEPKRKKLNQVTGFVASAEESMSKATATTERDTHKWRWHATGAGVGWVCDGECDGHHRYTGDDSPPPKYGCARPQNNKLTNAEGNGDNHGND